MDLDLDLLLSLLFLKLSVEHKGGIGSTAKSTQSTLDIVRRLLPKNTETHKAVLWVAKTLQTPGALPLKAQFVRKVLLDPLSLENEESFLSSFDKTDKDLVLEWRAQFFQNTSSERDHFVLRRRKSNLRTKKCLRSKS
jgi:hypothetical protein